MEIDEIKKELAFLYDQCKKIRRGVMREIVYIPEYVSEIMNFDGYIDDKALCGILKSGYAKINKDYGMRHKKARAIINWAYKDVYGILFDEDVLSTNSELGFLYKKCKMIRPSIISKLNSVPEFSSALKGFTGTIDDEAVYQILKTEMGKISEDDKVYWMACDLMNKVSQDVKGNYIAWKDK